MNFLQRRRARLLITRMQSRADEPLIAAANFTWVGNSMSSQPGELGREDLAGGLPMWTLIGVGATRLFIVEADHVNPDRGMALVGSWPLNQIRLGEQTLDRQLGSVRLGAYHAIRFEFPDREPAVLQPVGREIELLLAAHRAAQPNARPAADRPDGLAEVALMTTSSGPGSDDVFFVLSYRDGTTKSVSLADGQDLLSELRDLPGFDDETFTRAMAVAEDGVSVLWRANAT